MCHVIDTTVLIDDREIFQARTVEDGIQDCDAINELLLQYPRLTVPYALLHFAETSCQSANGGILRRNSTAAQLQFSASLHRSGYQDSRDSQRGIVFADRLKIAVHHAICAGCGRKMRKA